MPKGFGRLLLTIGAVAYVAVFALILLVNLVNIEVFSILTLCIIAQGILGVPFLLFLFKSTEFPLVDYAKWLAAVVSVLAMSGLLGIPDSALRFDPTEESLQAEQRSIQEKMGAREALELAVDLAEEEDDDDKKEIKEKIEKIGDDLSSEDKDDLKREMNVAKKKLELARFDSEDRRNAVLKAQQQNALALIAAFLILAGAYLMRRENAA